MLIIISVTDDVNDLLNHGIYKKIKHHPISKIVKNLDYGSCSTETFEISQVQCSVHSQALDLTKVQFLHNIFSLLQYRLPTKYFQ